MVVRKLRVLMLRLVFGLIAFLAVFVRPHWKIGETVSTVVELAGYVFLLGGLAIRMWSILYVGGRKSQSLVTEGPYSICRHPLYVGTFLLAIGASLCFENLPMLAASLAVVLPVHMVVARMEERRLQEKFPDQYAAYRRQTPRFWPRLRNYHSRPSVEVSVRAIRRVAVDTVAVLLIPEIEDLLEVLHAHGIVPVLWQCP